MKTLFRIIILSLLAGMFSSAKADWYGDKYSMFIHYGLYSIPGGVFDGKPVTRGYSEQILTFGIGFSDWYEAYAREFTAQNFNPKEIVQLAKAAGMRSIVLTSKHHDGFCLWNTTTTDYNTYAGTPAKRDLVGELAQACHAAGMGFGLYFSNIDWHIPAAVPFSSHNADRITPEHHQLNLSQVRELLTKYGKIDEMWFDMGSLTPEQSEEMYKLVKSLQPDCMVSGRLGNDQADFCVMPDNQCPDYLIDMPWQSAASMFDETWGYRSWQERGSVEDKAMEKLTSLINVISSGGKYLLNIGPMGDGSVVPFEAEVLKRIGAYIEPMKEAIYGTLPTPFPNKNHFCHMTMSPSKKDLYVFVPKGQKIAVLPPTFDKPKSVRLLGGKALEYDTIENSNGQILIKGIKGDKPFNVIHVQYAEPIQPVLIGEGELFIESKLTLVRKGIPIFAQSSGDYYSTFKSIVGYRYVIPASHTKILLSFPTDTEGREILINGHPFKLDRGSHVVTQTSKTTRPITAAGPLLEASATGLMGTIKDIDDYIWNNCTHQWTDEISKVVGTKSGVIFRQKLNCSFSSDYRFEINYTEGIIVYLNGQYIDAASALEKGGKLTLRLPLKNGENDLVIKLYARWGEECKMKITPLDEYKLYTIAIPPDLINPPIHERYTILEIKRPHSATLASPAHLSELKVTSF